MAINLSEEQRIALQKVLGELQARQAAGTAPTATRSGVVATAPVASTTQQELAQIKQQNDLSKVLNEVQKRQEAGTFTPTATESTIIQKAKDVATGQTQLSQEQISGLQAISGELQKRQDAGTPANEARVPTGTTNVANLGATPPPTNTTPTTPTPTTNIPAAATATTEISDNIQKKIEEENKAYQAKLEADQKAQEEKLKASMGTTETGYAGLAEKAQQRPTLSMEEKLAQENEKAGITALQTKLSNQTAKITAIQNEIAQDEATQIAEVEQARTRLSSMEMISQDISEINYKYNLQKAKKTALLGAEAAVAQVYQGDLTSAKNMVADVVNAYTADKQSEVNKFDNLFNVYSAWTSSLDSNEKAILENAHQTAISELQIAKEDATNVMNMMLQYPSAGIQLTDSPSTATQKASIYQNTHKDESAVLQMQYQNPGAGILPTDTIQTATQKAEQYQIAHKDENAVLEMQATYVGAGIKPTDTLATAVQKAENYQLANPQIETQVVGTEGTGYKLINKNTGDTIKVISDGTGIDTTNTKAVLEDMASDMSTIASQPDRATAETLLNQNKSAMILRYGQDGYNKIASEIDRIWPVVIEQETKPTNNWLQNLFKPKETTTTNNTTNKTTSSAIDKMSEIGSGMPDTTSWFNQLFKE